MFRITPREEKYYDLFVETSDNAVKAAEMLQDLMHNYVDIDKKVAAIEAEEHRCDQHVHFIIESLNKSFITPIDREDIFAIAKVMDNIVDDIEATAHYFVMYNVKSISEEALQMSDLIVQCTKALRKVMVEFKDMKKSKTLHEHIVEVNRIENLGDRQHRQAVTRLFSDDVDAREVIKWIKIYDNLEDTLDSCEDVANLVEGVVTKHA